MSETATSTENNFDHDMNCIELVGIGDVESLTK